MNEIIYIIINEAMPGYVKIGRTTNLNQRIRNLYRTDLKSENKHFKLIGLPFYNEQLKKEFEEALENKILT